MSGRDLLASICQGLGSLSHTHTHTQIRLSLSKKPLNPSIHTSYLVEKHRSTDYKACKLRKGRSGLLERMLTKEATLERADFQAGWSELSWSGRAQPVLALNRRDSS